VTDAPRFIWRGVLLDVGRHFFPLPFILKLLDLMALYKMNRFHWHLTEDQVGVTGEVFCKGYFRIIIMV
jgi:hexosaminidase